MTESQICLDQMKAKLQSGITVSPHLRESSLNPMRYPQKNVLQPHWNSTHQYPPESSTHVSHSMSRHYGQGNILPTYDMSTVQYQTTPSGIFLSFRPCLLCRWNNCHPFTYGWADVGYVMYITGQICK